MKLLQNYYKHATRNTQHATRNTQHATRNTQHATRNTQHATRNTQHATRNTQHATRNTQHATRNTQHATRNTQHATRNTQHATRNTQHATRNTQHATRNKRNYYYLIITLLTAFALSSCGLRSNDSSMAATETMTMAATETMTPTVIPNTIQPDTLTFSDNNFGGLTTEQITFIITSAINTENNSVTRGRNPADSITVKDDNDNLMRHVENGLTVDIIRVNNERADSNWAKTPAISLRSDIFDNTDFTDKELSAYVSDDFYIVTGFWYRGTDDFGVFADGSPQTEILSVTGMATYKGVFNGYAWSFDNSDTENFTGDVELSASVSGDGIVMGGTATTQGTSTSPFFTEGANVIFTFTDKADNSDGVFTGGEVNFRSGGSGSWDGRFVGNPVTGDVNSDDWPAGFVGTFNIRDGDSLRFDVIGTFGTIHDDLCIATTFCTK